MLLYYLYILFFSINDKFWIKISKNPRLLDRKLTVHTLHSLGIITCIWYIIILLLMFFIVIYHFLFWCSQNLQIPRKEFGPSGQRPGETAEPKKDKQQFLTPQNAEGRSHNFQRQRSFVTKENNQRRQSPLTDANSPPRNQRYVLLGYLT